MKTKGAIEELFRILLWIVVFLLLLGGIYLLRTKVLG